MRAEWIVAGLALAACGGGTARSAPLAVDVEGPVATATPAYLASPDLGDRTRAVAVESAAAWGSPAEMLDGWRITFAQQPFACGGDAAHAIGCTHPARREIVVLAFGAGCPEATALPHEIGHAIVGDPEHHDPRWCDPAFWRALGERLAREAPASCPLDDFVARNLETCGDERDGD